MYCNNCGANNNDNATNCSSCGAPLGNQNQGQMTGGNQGGPGQFGSFGIAPKNIATCVILSIVTCGIYAIIWFIGLTDDSNRVSNEAGATSGGMAFVLTLVTCGIYSIYWIYKRGVIIDNYYASKNMPRPNNAVIYLVLTLFGLGIVSYCLLQSELNKIANGQI